MTTFATWLVAFALHFAHGAAVSRWSDISSVPHSAWDALQVRVQGHLHAEYPMGAFCYSRYEGSLNRHLALGECAKLLANQQNTSFMASYAQGYAYSTWTMCIADEERCNTEGKSLGRPASALHGNCQQGSVPSYYIDAHTDEDIKAGLAFAQQHNIPLVIKASGHDYKGRSAGKGSLMIWLYKYESEMRFEKDFVPVGASEPIGDAISFGAGHDMESVASFADQHGGAVISGTAKSVYPAGGFLQGGGHSPLSVVYGLAVDNAYQIEGILANGTSFKASRQQHADLFFALRGGGGGTFAIVTRVYTLFLPNPAEGYQFAFLTTTGLSSNASSSLLKILIANAEQWASDGWGGYALLSTLTNRSSALAFINPKLNIAEAQASLSPLTNFLNATLGNVSTFSITAETSYFSIFSQLSDTIEGGGISEASRLVPVQNFRGQQSQAALFDALYPIGRASGDLNTHPLFICLTPPYSYGNDDQTSSVTTAWRKALWHVIAVNKWDPNESSGRIVNEFRKTHSAVKPLVKLTPGSGAYQNEADTYETDPVETFWGRRNYEKLLAIKQRYDPNNVFAVWQGVGWDREDSRWACYPEL